MQPQNQQNQSIFQRPSYDNNTQHTCEHRPYKPGQPTASLWDTVPHFLSIFRICTWSSLVYDVLHPHQWHALIVTARSDTLEQGRSCSDATSTKKRKPLCHLTNNKRKKSGQSIPLRFKYWSTDTEEWHRVEWLGSPTITVQCRSNLDPKWHKLLDFSLARGNGKGTKWTQTGENGNILASSPKLCLSRPRERKAGHGGDTM